MTLVFICALFLGIGTISFAVSVEDDLIKSMRIFFVFWGALCYVFLGILFHKAMDEQLEKCLIEDGKIKYVSDNYGDTKIILLDSTMAKTFKELYGEQEKDD